MWQVGGYFVRYSDYTYWRKKKGIVAFTGSRAHEDSNGRIYSVTCTMVVAYLWTSPPPVFLPLYRVLHTVAAVNSTLFWMTMWQRVKKKLRVGGSKSTNEQQNCHDGRSSGLLEGYSLRQSLHLVFLYEYRGITAQEEAQHLLQSTLYSIWI